MKPATLLHRQVHPVWVQEGRITSQAFRPTPKDEKRLSVYNGDRVDARGAWEHFTETLGFISAGGVAVSVEECEGIGLTAAEDPLEFFPEHAIIDFAGFGTSQTKKAAERLREFAVERSWLYRPE
jgi:hypothetical protein